MVVHRSCERARWAPQVVLRIAGPSGDGASGTPSAGTGGAEAGALLRFLGEGVSLVSRREMLGMSLAPNITMQRLDITARFVATIPLQYLPRRKSWRPETGFKIEVRRAVRSHVSCSPAALHAALLTRRPCPCLWPPDLLAAPSTIRLTRGTPSAPAALTASLRVAPAAAALS